MFPEHQRIKNCVNVIFFFFSELTLTLFFKKKKKMDCVHCNDESFTSKRLFVVSDQTLVGVKFSAPREVNVLTICYDRHKVGSELRAEISATLADIPECEETSEVMILAVGGNNIVNDFDDSNQAPCIFIKRYEEMVDALTVLRPAMDIYICSLIPRVSNLYNEQIKECNLKLRDLCEAREALKFLPIYADFTRGGRRRREVQINPSRYQEGLIRPNQVGSEKLANFIFAKLR